MSLVSEAGSRRSSSAPAASVCPLRASTRTKARAATGGATGPGAAVAAGQRNATRTSRRASMVRLAGGDGGREPERLAHLVGDGRRLLAIAVGAQAHAMQPVAHADIDGLEDPGKAQPGAAAKLLGVLGAGEGAQLQPERARLLRYDRRLDVGHHGRGNRGKRDVGGREDALDLDQAASGRGDADAR